MATMGRPRYGKQGRKKFRETVVRYFPPRMTMYEVAYLLHVTYKTVYNWVHKSNLPVFRRGQRIEPVISRGILNRTTRERERNQDANEPKFYIDRQVLVEWLIEREQLAPEATNYIQRNT